MSAPLASAVSTSDEQGARRILCLEQGDEAGRDAVRRVATGVDRSILPSVVEQHVDEANSLWMVRNHLISAPHWGIRDLERHDARLEAHLHGLRLAGEAGWELCSGLLESNYPEDMFAPAVLAFEKGADDRVREVLAAVRQDKKKARTVISALGWLTYEQAEPHIGNFLASESGFHRYIGIAASALHRRDTGDWLDAALDDDDQLLKARALRAVGELGGREGKLTSKIREYLNADNEEVRFSAAWSAALIGDEEATEVLKSFVIPVSRCRESALNVVVRRMEPARAIAWLKELSSGRATIRLAVVGAGILGDPVLVPWLLEQMKSTELSRAAGEAFTLITGVDIELEGMKGFRPEGFDTGPSDDPDDYSVMMDADANLPWPDPDPIWKWWNLNAKRFPCGERHFLGCRVSGEHLRQVLRTGCQRQRAAAALELAILEPGRPLFEVKAPGFRQLEKLKHTG
ncbi:MAG: TIGR02270 family protein [Geobacteraceae bacterium]|nr:TIGR02270 family protein [Geobacteraceae bacterium]